MNLKTNYHYTYFIYPFLVSQNKYNGFIKKIIGDSDKWKINIRSNSVDLSTHAYFLPYVKKFLFPTLYWSQSLKDQFPELSILKKVEIVSRLSCVNFDYIFDDNHDNRSYRFEKSDISFEFSKIELICFEPGICFLLFKTQIDTRENVYSDDILDFNYKFRTINPKYLKKKKTEGISLSNQDFKDLDDFTSFIDRLLYGYEDVEKENIYFDRLFTYSFMCIDESEWNEKRELNDIINEFYKFLYVLPSDYGSTFAPDFKGVKENTYSRWKYSIYGFSREACVLFSSEKESFNCVKLPRYFESMYFYIFILAFFQRISLILFSQELMTGGKKNIEDLKSRFTKFTHFSWFSQITNSEQGMDIWKKWQRAFELPLLFDEVQKEYAEYYDFTVAQGQERINTLLIIIYIVSVLFTGIDLMVNFGIIRTNNFYAKVFLDFMVGTTVLLYPFYLLIRWLTNLTAKHKKNYYK